MSGPDSGQFHRDLLREVEANREHIERLEAELARRDVEEARQREWMNALGGVLSRLTGQPPPSGGQPDELGEQRRRRRERGNRRAGFVALPIAVGALLRRSLTRWALASAGAATVALAAGGTILAVDSHPFHGHPANQPVPAAHSSPLHTPGRSRPRPTPRRGQGKGTAARSTTDTTPPVSRSRAAVPHTTAPATQPATLPVVTVPSPHTHLPSPLPTSQPIPAILPNPIPSVTKVIGHLVCHLNLLGIRVCVHTG